MFKYCVCPVIQKHIETRLTASVVMSSRQKIQGRAHRMGGSSVLSAGAYVIEGDVTRRSGESGAGSGGNVGRTTNVSWCDASFSPWWGCLEVDAACDHCYARELSHRFGYDIWGKTAPRRFF